MSIIHFVVMDVFLNILSPFCVVLQILYTKNFFSCEEKNNQIKKKEMNHQKITILSSFLVCFVI